MDLTLFVYGTLRRGAGHPMGRWLRKHARPLGPAWFQGRLYDLGPYPGAILSGIRRERVVGELWRLHCRANLRRLDDYEGCNRRGAPAEYLRQRVHVARFDATREAWIYLWLGSVRFRRRIRSGDWFRRPGR